MFLCTMFFVLFKWSSLGYISGIYINQIRVINGEYNVKISRGIVEFVYGVKPFDVLEV